MEICPCKRSKHCVKRRKCWLPAFSRFPTMSLKGLFLRVIKSQDCVEKGQTQDCVEKGQTQDCVEKGQTQDCVEKGQTQDCVEKGQTQDCVENS